jgi:hypothetical protein
MERIDLFGGSLTLAQLRGRAGATMEVTCQAMGVFASQLFSLLLERLHFRTR